MEKGTIIEEKKVRFNLGFHINFQSFFSYHPLFLTLIGSIGFLAIIFAVSYNIFIHSAYFEELIANEVKVQSTGAILGEKSPEQVDIDKLAEKLLQQSPLSVRSFTLTFDYATNAFLIKPKNHNPNFQTDFIDWLNTSEYRTLPSRYFQFAAD